MNDESSMTSRWRAGCSLAFGAGFLLAFAYQTMPTVLTPRYTEDTRALWRAAGPAPMSPSGSLLRISL